MGAPSAARLEPPSAAFSGDRAFLAAATLAAVATTLLLEATRVFIGYLVIVFDQSNRGPVASVAFGVALAVGLGGPLVRGLGARGAMVAAGVVLGGARLGLQFWRQPEAGIVLGAAAIVAWGWLIVPLLGTRPTAAAYGLSLGLGLDLAVRIAFGSVDLPWLPGVAAHVLSVALVGVGGAALAATRITAGKPSFHAAAALVGLGPALALYHLMTGNLGLAQVKLDLSFPWAATVLALGTAIGVALGGRVPAIGQGVRRSGVAAVGLVTLAGLWLFWGGGPLGSLGAAAGVAGSVVLLTRLLLAGAAAGRGGAAAGGVWLAAGMALQMALFFAYYASAGLPAVIALAAIGLAVAAVLASGPRFSVAAGPQRPVVPAALGAVLAAACGWQFVARSEPSAGPPLPREATVMTYNIDLGFDHDGRWNMEGIARAIEAERPDVVVLQEVTRGWLVAAGADQVRWLSHRLGMPIVFGAASGDGLWGNAVLTRAPVRETAVHRFAEKANLTRGATLVRLATEAGDLWVLGTHLDNPREAGRVRLAQVNELLSLWGGRTPALLLGDLNEDPDGEALAALAAAGFVDLGAAGGPGVPTAEDGRRIDYVLAAPAATVRDARVPETAASDHRPVVVELTLAP